MILATPMPLPFVAPSAANIGRTSPLLYTGALMPRYLPAFVCFAIRYFLKGGFLDGYAGWMWNFWQGLWYRCLVDHEIGKIQYSHISRNVGMAKADC